MTVAVIGAGLAGLACARVLQEQGDVVSVFDKGRGPGGRLSTSRGPGWQGDMGAQYFTVRDPDFQQELRRWIAAGVAAEWQPRLVWLDGSGRMPVDDDTPRYVGAPRMGAISRYLADGLDLRLGQRVGQLQPTDKGIRLGAADGRSLGCFRQIVLAVPAPQAVELLAQPAPELAARAAQARMRGCWTLIIELESGDPLPFDAAFVREPPLSWVARDGSKPGRAGETWVVHADAGWSQSQLEAQPADVEASLLTAFRRLTGVSGELQIHRTHRWRYASTADSLDAPYLLDAKAGIAVCGDWCLGNRVEAAWLSGRALAAALRRGGVSA